jgi:hypothetical protein
MCSLTRGAAMSDTFDRYLPESVKTLIAYSRQQRPIPRGSSVQRVGDVCRVIVDSSESRLVLLLSIDSRKELVQFTLVHPYSDFAIDRDVIVPIEAADLGFEAVVETDIRGVMPTLQLGRVVGSVPLEVVDCCFELSLSFPTESQLEKGSPLKGPLDARWAFKAAEGETIRKLSSGAANVLLDGYDNLMLDVDPILKTIAESGPDSTLIALALLDLWERESDSIMFLPEHLDALLAFGLLDSQVWFEAIGDGAEHFLIAVLFPLIDAARSRSQSHFEGKSFLVREKELKELTSA